MAAEPIFEARAVLVSAEATFALGQKIGMRLVPGDLVTLSGELGAGKTTLCRGIAAGVGVADLSMVTSPTYALMHEYPSRDGWLVHIDAYRLSHGSHAFELGLEEAWQRRDAIIVIEWAERLGDLLPTPVLHVTLALADHAEEMGRMVTLRGPWAQDTNLES